MREFIRTVIFIVTVLVLSTILLNLLFPDAHATVIDYGTTCYWIGDVLYCN